LEAFSGKFKDSKNTPNIWAIAEARKKSDDCLRLNSSTKPLSACEQKDRFDKAVKDGLASLKKFYDECKNTESVYSLHAWREIQEISDKEYKIAQECMMGKKCNVMSCLGNYVADFPKTVGADRLLDVASVGIKDGRCIISSEDDKYVFTHKECGFTINDNKLEIVYNDTGSFSITYSFGPAKGFNWARRPAYCDRLLELPGQHP